MVIYSIEFSKDGKYLISSDFDGVLKVFDSKKFDLIAQTPKMPTENRVFYNLTIFINKLNKAYSCNLDFSAESKLTNNIYVGYMDTYIRMWKLDPASKKLELVKEMQGHLDAIKNVALKGDLGIVSTSARVHIY